VRAATDLGPEVATVGRDSSSEVGRHQVKKGCQREFQKMQRDRNKGERIPRSGTVRVTEISLVSETERF
jgi:hypothetical protein